MAQEEWYNISTLDQRNYQMFYQLAESNVRD